MHKKNGFLRFLYKLILLSAAGAIWYAFQSESRQRYIRNLLKQIPDLPGRYSV
jgi:hypothetical protein